jgi:hypothetical protein
MLWEVRNIIDIPATFANNEEYYKACFVVFATDTWRFCGGTALENQRITRALIKDNYTNLKIEMDTEKHRRTHVYPNLAAVCAHYFDDQEGLELLRLPGGSEAKTDRCTKWILV